MQLDPEVLRSLPVWFVATLLSLTVHEAAHALFGRLGGDDTAHEQVTLDPTPHVRREPFGMILVPILSFLFNGGQWMIGFASAPYDPHWAARHPKRAAWMAAAGPLADLLLALIAAVVLRLGLSFWGWQAIVPETAAFDALVVGPEGEPTALTTFFSVLFSVNILIGLFNLIPVAPLDGHAVVPLFLSEKLTQRWHALFEDRAASFVGLAIAWVLFGRLAWPVFEASVQLFYVFV
ncbi:MAG: site-2 protease family protein [Sandaracinus sp.]|nr:site-2 protease family protein [Sandaracinus sp.]MCB9618916.1 site-2 protease family protein [Sandaracinus sp.]MCB9625356.1 site-2 protease family protein [Sandaracinus sp.]MCB9633746.1 site-2 protease family protein [Sandaracinus sp.]